MIRQINIINHQVEARPKMSCCKRLMIALAAISCMVCVALFPSGAFAQTVGPSFRCEPPSTDALAQLTCSDQTLARSEIGLVQTYYALRQTVGPSGQNALKSEYLSFVIDARRACGLPPVDPQHDQRNAVLQDGAAKCVTSAYDRQRAIFAARLGGPAADEAARDPAQNIALQGRLQSMGFLPKESLIDGVFGTATRSAIVAWQNSQGRPATSFFGNEDASLLLAIGSSSSDPADQFIGLRQLPLAHVEFLGKPITIKTKDIQIDLAIEEVANHELCSLAAKQVLLFPDTLSADKLVCRAVIANISREAKDAQNIFILIGEDNEELRRFYLKIAIQKLTAESSRAQLVFTAYSGGAHCCTDTVIGSYGEDGDWHFVDAGRADGDRGYDYLDIIHDGTSVLVGNDGGNFNYRFSSYAGSYPPTQILKLSGLTIRNVTHELPYRGFLLQQLQSMEASAKKYGGYQRNGFLAGWVAQKALVGQLEDGWNTMLKLYDRASTDGVSGCRVNEEVYVKTDYRAECPESEKVDYIFPEALAIHLVETGYITKDQSARLGHNIDYIQTEKANQTARYKEKMVTGWFVVTRDGVCTLARFSSSPAEMVTADRGRGLEDNIVVLETDEIGKPIVVRIEEPKANGLVSTVTFHRGFTKCEALRLKRDSALKDLK